MSCKRRTHGPDVCRTGRKSGNCKVPGGKGADINLKDSKGMSVYDYLSGKAPYLGNFKYSPTSVDYDFSPPEKHENKNVTPEQADDFIEFLKNVFKSPAALSEFTV